MTTDPYFSTRRGVERLLEQYELHGDLIVAFDFDDTIYDYHKKGHTYPKVIRLLRECSRLGLTLIMFSTKESAKELEASREYCGGLGLKNLYVNRGPVMPKARKPFFNVYLDDKAGLRQAYEILDRTVRRLRRRPGPKRLEPRRSRR